MITCITTALCSKTSTNIMLLLLPINANYSRTTTAPKLTAENLPNCVDATTCQHCNHASPPLTRQHVRTQEITQRKRLHMRTGGTNLQLVKHAKPSSSERQHITNYNQTN